MIRKLLIIALLSIAHSSCRGQNTTPKRMTPKNTNNNPLLCDPVSGLCTVPDTGNTPAKESLNQHKSIRILYFTDPICSSCWGIEPQLRKLKLEYGHLLNIDYHMGGLLPDWSYNSGGISKPSDVAHHWDEVSLHYDMPIDGDVWLEDPLPSSYPPSIAFKAAQMQSKEKAIQFMRILRERVFLQKQNICKWPVMEAAAAEAGLNTAQLKTDYDGAGPALFEQDLLLARSLGVRGFPSIFFVQEDGTRELVYGSRPYSAYESALLKILPDALRRDYDKSAEALFAQFPSLTAREYAELSGTARAEAEASLDKLSNSGFLKKLNTKNGAIWRK